MMGRGGGQGGRGGEEGGTLREIREGPLSLTTPGVSGE